jgi:formate hydrogenlyase subunit 3/multisubunit Na+/H+ antiporter MnhD subunit
MQRKLSIIVFIISFALLTISAKLFWNLAVFADEHNSSPSIISGGDFWLAMDWVRLLLLVILCIVSCISLFKGGRDN